VSIYSAGPIYWVLTKSLEAVAPLIIKAAEKIPEPTKGNTGQTNSHVLIDLRDSFFIYLDMAETCRTYKLLRAVWNLIIIKYDQVNLYRHMFDWFIEKLIEKYQSGEWEPRPQRSPGIEYWKEFRQ